MPRWPLQSRLRTWLRASSRTAVSPPVSAFQIPASPARTALRDSLVYARPLTAAAAGTLPATGRLPCRVVRAGAGRRGRRDGSPARGGPRSADQGAEGDE